MALDRIPTWSNPTIQGQTPDTRLALTSLGKYITDGYPPYAMRANRSAALAVAAAPSNTTIVADLVQWDYSGCYSTSTGAYTCALPGTYECKGAVQVGLQSNPDEYLLEFLVNGILRSAGGRAVIRGATAGDLWSFVISDNIDLKLRDTVTLVLNHAQGGNATTLSIASPSANYLAIHRVGP